MQNGMPSYVNSTQFITYLSAFAVSDSSSAEYLSFITQLPSKGVWERRLLAKCIIR